MDSRVDSRSPPEACVLLIGPRPITCAALPVSVVTPDLAFLAGQGHREDPLGHVCAKLNRSSFHEPKCVAVVVNTEQRRATQS